MKKTKMTSAKRKRLSCEQKLMLLRLKLGVRKVTMEYSISQYRLAQQALRVHEKFIHRQGRAK
jgi:hypothetical protein